MVESVAFQIDRTTKLVQTFTEDLGDGIGLDMVLIPPGEFLMGSPPDEPERQENEGPQHLVTIDQPFFMGQYLVTQPQWAKVATMPQVKRKIDSADLLQFKGLDLPVENVSWLDAEEFCLRLSAHTPRTYRLPSEAEWEYACRARTTMAFYFGETIDSELANYQAEDEVIGKTIYPGKYGRGKFGEYRKKTTSVGSFPANDFGLYDMHGNLWEWCEDHFQNSYEGASTDGSAWIDPKSKNNASRVLRGGSWLNAPWRCRSAYRLGPPADSRNSRLGFRLVYSSMILSL
jgi:formylglycine-generating enzyme required for sulfatase activity